MKQGVTGAAGRGGAAAERGGGGKGAYPDSMSAAWNCACRVQSTSTSTSDSSRPMVSSIAAWWRASGRVSGRLGMLTSRCYCWAPRCRYPCRYSCRAAAGFPGAAGPAAPGRPRKRGLLLSARAGGRGSAGIHGWPAAVATALSAWPAKGMRVLDEA